MYYSLGRSLEAVWGAFRFNVFFFMGAIGIILAEFIVYFIWGWDMHLNTSYLSMSIFLAYAVMFPEEYFYIYFILAIKAKWLALFDAFFLVFGFVYGSLPPVSYTHLRLWWDIQELGRIGRSPDGGITRLAFRCV